MILSIILEILIYWIGMGAIIALGMTSCLYFAIFCEKIADVLYRH